MKNTTVLKKVSNEVFEILERKNVDVKVVTDILDCFINNIETEKYQIIDAYNSGWQYGFLANSEQLKPTKNSETYFNETFN